MRGVGTLSPQSKWEFQSGPLLKNGISDLSITEKQKKNRQLKKIL